MKTFTIISAAVLCTALFSCQENKKEMEVKVAEEHMDSGHKLQVKVDNALDPVCEMSTADHLSDTIHYQGKVYGFCSAICKEEFAKNPGEFLTKLD